MDMKASQIAITPTVISGPGSEHEVAITNRGKICLTNEGMLYIAEAYKTDADVLSYISLLHLDNILFKIKYTSTDLIQRMYSIATGDSENSNKQEQVITLIKKAVQLDASDIHFRNYAGHTEVWWRIDGFLELDNQNVFNAADGMTMCGTIYRSMCDVAEEDYIPTKSQDGRISREFLTVCGLIGARISTRPMDHGNVMILRLLARKERQSLKNLGYLDSQLKTMTRMTERKNGINIFSGETGSGKSTSMEVLLSNQLEKSRYRIHVLTIENPPENVIKGAVQTPILCDWQDPAALPREWARSISNSLRLDPDIIMIGEIRDLNSATAAFRAAMTGHSVWTTVHANNAMLVLERLRDMGIDIGLLTDASIVTGLINQSLVPKNCEHCKRPYIQHRNEVHEELRKQIEFFCDPAKVFLTGDDKSCPHCNGRGYKGRTVIAETVIPTQALLDVFKCDGNAAARRFWVNKQNGITKNQHLILKINQGIVDPCLGERMVCALNDDTITLK